MYCKDVTKEMIGIFLKKNKTEEGKEFAKKIRGIILRSWNGDPDFHARGIEFLFFDPEKSIEEIDKDDIHKKYQYKFIRLTCENYQEKHSHARLQGYCANSEAEVKRFYSQRDLNYKR